MHGYTAHKDTFARDQLPPREQWPTFHLSGFDYPEKLNAAVELTDSMVRRGFGDHTAVIGDARRFTYRELTAWTNRLARALVEDYGVEPGNRVLIRGGNTPSMLACWLAATKAGAVVVNTMPMLRASELKTIIDRARIELALCDWKLTGELQQCSLGSRCLRSIVGFDGSSGLGAELDYAARGKPADFRSVETASDDIALLAFTSGTTGQPKATMHFHRDLLAIADGYAREVLSVTSQDIVVGSPPLAFTFGLGGLAIFPLRFGAATVLVEDVSPASLLQQMRRHRVTLCFTAPPAYRALLAQPDSDSALASLRLAISAGSTLPGPIFEEWTQRTGVPILDGIGATEMLHIFISNRAGAASPGSTGTPVKGYIAKILDKDMREAPRGEVGALAVQGPTGCRYLDDPRQLEYVRDGWNLTGDAYWQDEQGRFHFVGRNDDMIISAGYNIAAPEVEAALLSHPDVRECAVIGAPDAERGQIVEAHIVLAPAVAAEETTAKRLQDHVKATIAPYKYPRAIHFKQELPKTPSGKIQHYRLRQS